jgi:PAS domain S-box-containing protein
LNTINKRSDGQKAATLSTNLPKTFPDPWRCIFEESTLAIARLDLNGRFLESNRAYSGLVGYSQEELRDLTLLELTANEDRAAYAELTEQLQHGKRRDFQIETRYRRKDGYIIWVHNTVSLIPGASESPGFLMTIAKDITARKNASDSLKEQNEILYKIFDHAPVMVSFVAKDSSIKLVNREWERVTGWSLEEILRDKLDVFALSYPDAGYRSKVLKFVAESESEWVEFQARTKDGRAIDTTWARVRLSDGSSIGIGRDITASKRAEEALRRSEAYLAAGQRLSQTGSWGWSPGATELFWSQETFRIFDVDPATPAGSLLEVFLQRIHPEDRPAIELGIKNAGTQAENYVVDYRIVLPSGSIRHIHDVVYPVTNEAGQVLERYGVVMDVTESKLAEQERQRSYDQLRALTARLQDAREEERKKVAREIHDELGQALTSIKIDLSALAYESPAAPPQAKEIESILNVVDQTIKAVRRISTELRPWILDDLGLIAAVEWAAEEFEARTGTKCHLELSESASVIGADRATPVFRILQETLTNVARHANATCVQVRMFREAAALILEVRDNGRGITKEQVSAPESLGVRGMRERALLLEGELVIDGVSGQGTSVRVRIPIADPASAGVEDA